MPEFKYDLGEIVVLNPVTGEKGPLGKVIGRARWIEGNASYFVACLAYDGDIKRHQVKEEEIHRRVLKVEVKETTQPDE